MLCPVSGRHEFLYRNSRLPALPPGTSAAIPRIEECNVPSSLAANCPYGFALTFDYRGCSFPDRSQ
jgi:hypothetical protein